MQGRDRAWRSVLARFAACDDVPAERVTWTPDLLAGLEGAARTPDVSVVRQDSIVAAYGFEDPVVLVFGDDEVPGGCVHAGAGMQEESIFRRTGIHKRLLPTQYPLGREDCLYCADVPVVFDSEDRGYAPLATGKRMAFVCCAGIKFPSVVDNGTRLAAADEALLRKKVELIAYVAASRGHDALVLGALGCGVYGSPPAHVAEIMVDVVRRLETGPLSVVFAVTGAAFQHFSDAVWAVRGEA